MNSLESQLSIAHSLISRSNFYKANKILTGLCNEYPQSFDVCNLQSHLAKSKNDINSQYEFLEKSLKIEPRQPSVIIQLANLCFKNNMFVKAETLYSDGMKLVPSDYKMFYNYALTLKALNKLGKAIVILSSALEKNITHPNIFQVLGNIYQQTGESHLALQVYIKGLILFPHHEGLVLSKSNTLKLRGETQASKLCIISLKTENNIINVAHQYQLALLCIDSREYEQAAELLSQCIKLSPNFIDAHETLNKMHWEQNSHKSFLISYESSFNITPDDLNLHYSFIAMCLMAKQYDRASAGLLIAKKYGCRSHQFIHIEGIICLNQGDIEKAAAFFDLALAENPNNVRYIIDKANIYIRLSRIEKASNLLQRCLQKEPFNQEALGYLDICWRLQNNKKSIWLNNYQSFIHTKKLETPDGYTSFESFWDELKATIMDLHGSKNQPLDQSVQNGTQTSGQLLARPISVIQGYKGVLHKRVNEYLETLPVDPSHPFLARNSKNFYFSGSWSVKLGNNGYHSNHIHPLGWLSSCTYITVPSKIKKEDTNKNGWLKFGQSSLDTENKAKIELEICPEEGLCVLFPAYFWHGTNPLTLLKHEARLTALSDIEPFFG
jgi:tetratricopeptide (TPR) repeat protein